MINTICLDENYSTTKLLTKEKPEIVKNPEDKFASVLFLQESEGRKGEGGLRTQGYFKKSYDEKPLISIVTVVFNGEKYLEQTIQSVINQSYDNVEYIIIDGGSSDGTLDIIKKFEDRIDYWISEKDEGIYDAMNKGLTLCQGEIIGIINADDYYELNAVEKSVENLLPKNDFSYTYGNVNFIQENGIIHQKKPVDKKELNKKIYQEMAIPHISLFIKKDVYKELGLFDTSYRIAADHEFLVRMHVNRFHGFNTNIIIGNIHDGGISHGISANFESMKTAMKYNQNKVTVLLKFILSIVKKTIKKILPSNLFVYIAKFSGSRHYK